MCESNFAKANKSITRISNKYSICVYWTFEDDDYNWNDVKKNLVELITSLKQIQIKDSRFNSRVLAI